MVGFADDVGKQLNQLIADGEKDIVKSLVASMTATYDGIVEGSPVFSAYYASNHRIIIRNSKGQFRTQGSPKLVPPTRPSGAERFEFIDNVAVARDEEVSKLSRVEIGDTVTIATNVPYADQVEQLYGVYSNAEATLIAL